jgi:hypothetical protein
MARPRGNDWLSDEMDGLREAGTDVLVSMLTPDEVTGLDLQGAAKAAAAAGRGSSLVQRLSGVPDAQQFRELLKSP